MNKQDTALLDAGDEVPDAWEAANTAFHTALVSACGSRWLLKVRAGLNDQCARYRRAAVYQRRGERDLRAEHSAISAAALARDADLASALTTRHFALTATDLPHAARAKALHE